MLMRTTSEGIHSSINLGYFELNDIPYNNYVTSSNEILMERNIPRAAIHVGKDKKSFYSEVGKEAEGRG